MSADLTFTGVACTAIDISQHAFFRALDRGIDLADAVFVIETGETIASYPNDTPYPSRLMLGYASSNAGSYPLHVVVGEAPNGICTLITVYRPDENVWSTDFRTRKTI